MQPSCPNPASLFPSCGKGAEAAAPPVRDAFRQVLQNRLQDRVNSKNRGLRETRLRSEPGQGRTAAPRASDSGKAGESCARSGVLPPRQRRPGTPGSLAGLADGRSQAAFRPSANQGAAAANPPPVLEEFISFLRSLPGQTLEIPAAQVPAMASLLLSAALPQEEVDRLLAASGSQATTLSAADLTAAWQRLAAQTPAVAPLYGQGQSAAGSGQNPTDQDIRQTQDYRALWERPTLPEGMLPTLRLALARLGGSPEVLARIEEEGQGQGLSLARVWEVLQNVKNSLSRNDAENTEGISLKADPSQAALLGERQVTGEELEEWRQVLLKAGLPPAVVEKLMGRTSPANQAELKTTLLNLAPPEKPIPAAGDPKPLFLPPSLHARAFFWQSQTTEGQSGKGAGDMGQSPAPPFPHFSPAIAAEEAINFTCFPAQLQELAQGLANPGAPLSEAAAAWRLFSPEMQESLWSQLQSGVVANLAQGENRVTLNLNPPELGQIQLTLHLSGQELAVTAVAARPEVAQVATLGVPQLLQALAQQGLVLTQFQVRLPHQADGQTTPVCAGARERGGAGGGNWSTSRRRRSGEVNRFV